MLACQTKEALETFKAEGGFSQNEIKWVWHHLLSAGDKERVTSISKTAQQSLELNYRDGQVPISQPPVPNIREGDTIKYKHWTGKIVTSKVTQVDNHWNDGTLHIKHKHGTLSSNNSDLLEVIDQLGQTKWKRE
jgi:hypothetical protein